MASLHIVPHICSINQKANNHKNLCKNLRGQFYHYNIYAAIKLMARPLRLEFSGALYYVTSRGDRREDIYRNREDRQLWLGILGHVCDRFNWVIHGYYQMTNHYHLLVETVDGKLSRGMRQLNGVYTQAFNRRYNESGHLFQGRYKAILVQKEAYLLELTRYVVLNPVCAGNGEKPRRLALE